MCLQACVYACVYMCVCQDLAHEFELRYRNFDEWNFDEFGESGSNS